MAATAALKVKPQAQQTTTAVRRNVRTRTIPEQIADHVANAIIKGEFRDGEHLPEQKIAEIKHDQVLAGITTYRPLITLAWRDNVHFVPWAMPSYWRGMQEVGFK